MLGFNIDQNEGNETSVPLGTASVIVNSTYINIGDLVILLFYILGILITGSYYYLSNDTMAEIYVPELQKTCSLSSMTMQRYGHTQNGFLSCGGFDGKSWSDDTCELYVPGVGWRLEPYNLMEWKFRHTSWTLKNGSVLLLGSLFDGINTELVTPGFYLNNPIW